MRLNYYLRGLGIGIVVTALVMGVSSGKSQASMSDEQIIVRAKEMGMIEGVLSELESEEADEEESGADMTAAGESGADVSKEGAGTDEKAPTDAGTDKKAPADVGADEKAQADAGADEKPQADAGADEKTQADAGADEKAQTDAGADKKAPADVVSGEKQKTESAGETVKAGAQGDAAALKEKAENSAAALKEESEAMKAQVSGSGAKTATTVITIYPGEGSYTVSKKLAAAGLVESADIYDEFLCQNGYDKKLCTGNYEISSTMGAEEIARILSKQQN